MDEHIIKGNYSTEVQKYNTVKESSPNKKEPRPTSPNEKERAPGDKLVGTNNGVENEIALKTEKGNKGKAMFHLSKNQFLNKY